MPPMKPAQYKVPEIMSAGMTIVGESGRHYVLQQVLQEKGEHRVCLATWVYPKALLSSNLLITIK